MEQIKQSVKDYSLKLTCGVVVVSAIVSFDYVAIDHRQAGPNAKGFDVFAYAPVSACQVEIWPDEFDTISIECGKEVAKDLATFLYEDGFYLKV